MFKADIETRLSFKISGTLNSLHIKEGDRIQKGQYIAGIDPKDYKVQHEQALAQQQTAEAQFLTARSTSEPMERLYENNSVSLSDYEKAKVNYSSAEAQLMVANQQLEATHNQLEYTNISAPVDGIITSLMVEENELVSAGRVIATISSIQNPETEVAVPGSIIHQLSLGLDAIITLSSLTGQTFNGKIVKLAFASGQSSTFPVVLSISAPNKRLVIQIAFVFMWTVISVGIPFTIWYFINGRSLIYPPASIIIFIGSIIFLFGFIGISMTINFFKHWQISILDAEHYKQEKLKADYKVLQNHVYPHFLFNSLNVLISEIKHSPEIAVDFTRKISKVYRYVLQSKNHDLISLQKELEFI